jgi:peptide/nickel transport system substrate-binding protein
VVLILVAAACSSSSAPGTRSATTTAGAPAKAAAVVHLGFVADMQVPDPDIFYETEGNVVMTSVYEGLLRYKQDSTTIEAGLAQSWTVSPDGLTYTFTLRPGVKFHDGTAMDSTAAKASFQRRTSVNSAPSYMLAGVAGYDTPDAMTFVVHLKTPVSAFLDYVASPYSPKLQSPTALTAHAGNDMAQTWLKTHDVGTGPFQISDFVPGSHYTLTRFDGYWGPAPQVSQINIAIVPDLSTQQLELQNGQLQMILHGLSKQAVTTFSNDKKFQVVTFPAEFKTMLFVNPNKGIFKDPALRSALRSDINKSQIVSQVYGTGATVSTQMYPSGELPTGLAMDTPKYDPSVLAAAAKNLANKKVDIVFSSDDPRNQLDAEILQTELQTAGLDATVRGLAIAQTSDLPNHRDQAPDLLVATVNPDAAAPDTWGRPFYYTFGNNNGPLNFLLGSVPAADALMDQGLAATDPQVVQQDYGKAGDLYATSGDFITITDVKEVIVAQAGYTNFVHQPPVIFTVRFGELQLGG